MNGMDQEVSSELYDEYNYAFKSLKPTLSENNVTSKFPFTLPPISSITDEDGDFVVARKPSNQELRTIEIEHSKSTSLGLVGLQIWRGALLLADWIIYNRKKFSDKSVVLELGAGVGLTSIVAAMFSPVICTDVDKGNILDLIRHNVRKNEDITNYPVEVKELDFKSVVIHSGVLSVLSKVQVILAADVIYDNDLTESFVKTMAKLLCQNSKPVIYIALEKRYVFTMADCDVSAPCYDFFLECMQCVDGIMYHQVPIDFPQYFKYNRSKELVLWKVCMKVS